MCKRLVDIVFSAVALVLLAPLLAIVSVLVRRKLGSPILFRQQRPGRGGEPFQMLKFRTMTEEVDRDGNLLHPSQRLTTFGRTLRSMSLDELPELVNVLRGDMSLVGPRPLRMEYIPLYTDFQMRRHDVRPGITGLAQISGRNMVSWEKRFELDVWYVENQSLRLDLCILSRTFLAALRREGTHASDGGVIDAFTGSSSSLGHRP